MRAGGEVEGGLKGSGGGWRRGGGGVEEGWRMLMRDEGC